MARKKSKGRFRFQKELTPLQSTLHYLRNKGVELTPDEVELFHRRLNISLLDHNRKPITMIQLFEELQDEGSSVTAMMKLRIGDWDQPQYEENNS